MDPQHRQFLECSWEALERAGCVPSRFAGSIGVFAGCGMGSYFAHNILSRREQRQRDRVYLEVGPGCTMRSGSFSLAASSCKWAYDPAWREASFDSLFHLAHALGAEAVTKDMLLLAATCGALRVLAEPLPNPEQAMAHGLCQVIARESPNLRAVALDLPLPVRAQALDACADQEPRCAPRRPATPCARATSLREQVACGYSRSVLRNYKSVSCACEAFMFPHAASS